VNIPWCAGAVHAVGCTPKYLEVQSKTSARPAAPDAAGARDVLSCDEHPACMSCHCQAASPPGPWLLRRSQKQRGRQSPRSSWQNTRHARRRRQQPRQQGRAPAPAGWVASQQLLRRQRRRLQPQRLRLRLLRPGRQRLLQQRQRRRPVWPRVVVVVVVAQRLAGRCLRWSRRRQRWRSCGGLRSGSSS
jgi:hypothetical protein